MESSESTAKTKLIEILQLAYSGELAAGYAYRGHWNSLSDPRERAAVKKIEDEEWHHRRLVGEMLASLDGAPNKVRELRATIVGRTLGLLCHVTGWFAPMYGAGRLESRNIVEYETAARYARECGLTDLIDCLLTMAEVEWEHEYFFRSCVLRHPWSKRISIWPQPLPKETIRQRTHEQTPAPAYPAVVAVAPRGSTTQQEEARS
jgi:hypothetical protein